MVWSCKQNAIEKASQTRDLLTKVKGKRPVERPRTRWADYIEDLGWNRLGLQLSKMLKVVADRHVW